MVFQGSKTKYAKYIVPILQNYLDNGNYNGFIDGMCGGCNIIDKINYHTKIAYDIDKYLIDLYIQSQKEDFKFPEEITREMWDNCKNNPEKNPDWLVALVAYFTSYSARGFKGGWAMNGTRDFYHERLKNFKAQLPKLKDVKFEAKDLQNLDCEGYLIYLDPPYKDTKPYDSTDHFDTLKFWEKVRELSKKNTVIISEQIAPSDFESIWSVQTSRNCFGSKLTEASEHLFVLKKSQD